MEEEYHKIIDADPIYAVHTEPLVGNRGAGDVAAARDRRCVTWPHIHGGECKMGDLTLSFSVRDF